MSAYPMWVLPIVALGAAICTLAGNWFLQMLARKQAAHDRVIMDAERFCDELMTHAAAYWSGGSVGESSESARLLERKIDVYVMLISRYIHQHFPDNTRIEGAMVKVNRNVTGGDFGKINRPPDETRFVLSVSAIINLRFAIAQHPQGGN